MNRLFFSPLRNIPGPPLAKITSKWLTFNELAGNRSLVVAKAHEKYGPVIRLAPDELSFSDRSCIKELYLQGSKFPKAGRYAGFASGTRASFDMTDKDQHRERRNLVRHVLAQSNIDECEGLIADQVRKSLHWIPRVKGQSLEVMLWLRRLMLDTAGGLFLGRSFKALENYEPPKFLGDLDDFFAIAALRWFAPWILAILSILPFSAVQHFLGAQHRSYEYGRKAFDEYIVQNGRHSGRIDLLTKMVATQVDSTGDNKSMTDAQIADELGSLLVGATDTTVVVATWMLWELAQRPGWQKRIRQELRENKVQFIEGVPRYKSVKSLPVLDGFVMESMRMHPAQSIGLQRVARTSDASLGGIRVPAGVSMPISCKYQDYLTDYTPKTVVSLQSRNVQRDPEVYPSPVEFLPERWIETNGGTKDMKDSFIIFSKGSRACLGQYVATMELKFFVVSFVNGWNLRLGRETTAETMKQADYFLGFPKARECHVIFEKAYD